MDNTSVSLTITYRFIWKAVGHLDVTSAENTHYQNQKIALALTVWRSWSSHRILTKYALRDIVDVITDSLS